MKTKTANQPLTKLFGCGLIFFALVAATLSSRAASADVLLIGEELHLEGQSGWEFYNGGDAPAGAFFGKMFGGVLSLPATVNLGKTIPAGSYRVFMKILDYDAMGRAAFSLGGGNGTLYCNDRDLNGYWTDPVIVNVSSATDRMTLTFAKTLSADATAKYMWMGLFITPNTSSATVDRYDFLIDWHYPTTAEYDLSPPVKENLVPNSSFETGTGNGWGLHSMPFRDEAISEAWAGNVGWNGASSLRLILPTNRWLQAISKPFACKANKKYTLSAWVKSSARNWGTIRLVNGYIPPEGAGYQTQQIISTGILAQTTWQRISVTGILLKYPVSDFHIYLEAQKYDGGTVYFDGVQLEEGDISPYAPAAPIEVGLLNTNLGAIFYADEPAQMQLRVFNSTASTITTNVDYEVLDYRNRTVSSGTRAVTVGAGQTAASDFLLDSTLRGIFRVRVWIRDLNRTEEEVVYSVISRPLNMGMDATSMMGSHIDMFDRQLGLMRKMGFKWTRGLSTGQCWRWENAEPTEGNFVYYDSEVALLPRYGMSIMANIGEKAPTWTYRTFFGVTNVLGTGFRVGEVVRAANGAQGVVTVVLTGTNATGHALQLTSVQGSFANGLAVTGQSSGTTALLRTAVYPESIALDKWENYVGAMLTHYKDVVQAWEIWNEPSQDGDHLPAPNADPGFYAEILRRAASKIRAIAPQAQIVSMGGVLYWDWMQKVMNRLPGSTGFVDAFAAHLYPPNGLVASDLKTNVVDVYGKPLWNTEAACWDLGFYSGVNANFRRQGLALMGFRYGDRFYRGQTVEAERTSVNFIESVGGGCSKYFFYDSRQAARPDYYAQGTSMIEFDDSIRAKGVVYGILGGFFDHSIGQGRVTLPDANLRTYLFDKSGTAMAGAFTRDRLNKTLDLSGTLSAGEIKVYDMMGNLIPLSTALIPVGRAPVYIVGQNISVARLRTAVLNGRSLDRPDAQAPQLSITVGPRGHVPLGELVQLRWLAIDDQDVAGEVDPLATLYSYKLQGLDADWSSFKQDTWIEYSGLPAGQYSMQVRAKDKTGNICNVVSRNFVVGTASTMPAPAKPSGLRVISGP